MKKNIYEELTSRFEGTGELPLPPGKNEPLTEWFKYWLTEEEARFLLYLPMMHEVPATLSDVAEKAGMPEEETAKMLEALAQKTMVYDEAEQTEEGAVTYYALSDIFFFVECYLNRYYDDNLDRSDDIHANLGRWYKNLNETEKLEPKVRFFRTIPIGEAIEDTRGSVSEYKATKIIEETSFICVLKCLCRSAGHLAGDACDYPLEVCFGLGEHARRYVERGFAREVTKEWAIKTINECEEMGLCHNIDNIKGEVSIICNCCPCHCMPLGGYKFKEQAARGARSEFVSTVDLDNCVGSGECVQTCPYGAIELENDKARVKKDRCVGCGMCCTVCPTKALSLKARPIEERHKIYENADEYFEAWASHSAK